MTDTPTDRMKLRQQSLASNVNVWGDPYANSWLQMIDKLSVGVMTVDMTGTNQTLTGTNYSTANQAGAFALYITGTTTFASTATMTGPAIDRTYLVMNHLPGGSAPLAFRSPTGTSVIVRNGDGYILTSDGTTMVARMALNRLPLPDGPIDFNGQRGTNAGTAVGTADLVTRQNSIDQLGTARANVSMGGFRVTNVGTCTSPDQAANKGYVDATAFSMGTGALPGQGGNAGKFLSTDGSNAFWGTIAPSRRVTSNVAASFTMGTADNQSMFFGSATSTQTVTLLAPSVAQSGFGFGFLNLGTAPWVLGGTVNGSANLAITEMQGVEVVSDGTVYGISAASKYKLQQTVAADGAGLIPQTTNGFSAITAESATNKVMSNGASFSPTTPQSGQYRFPNPRSYDAAGFYYARAWLWRGTSTGTGTLLAAQFAFQARGWGTDMPIDGTWGGTQPVVTVLSTATNRYQTPWTGPITPAGTAGPGSFMQFRVTRETGAAADLLAAAANVEMIETLVPLTRWADDDKGV